MRYARRSGSVKATGALVRVFVRSFVPPADRIRRSKFRFNGKTPAELLKSGEWTWCDLTGSEGEANDPLEPTAVVMLTFNAVGPEWTAERTFTLTLEGEKKPLAILPLRPSEVSLSTVTFLGPENSVYPDRLFVHVENRTRDALRLFGVRLYVADRPKKWTALMPLPPTAFLEPFPKGERIPAGDCGGGTMELTRIPLTYCAVEVILEKGDGGIPAWGFVKVRKESFDIGAGGANIGATTAGKPPLLCEPYLKTLKRMHVSAAHGDVPDGIPASNGLKVFGKVDPARYSEPKRLAEVHAAEALGNPQDGAKPIPPQEVYNRLLDYAATPIPTAITLSDESGWRDYAGLSDYPDFAAPRIASPTADDAKLYDRWPNGQRIGWGTPLETMGEMARCLHEMSRPAAIAAWSQGPGAGGDTFEGRSRTAPTPDELRMQAYHPLAARLTSLYWSNSSLKALITFRDTIEPMARIGREIRLLEPFYLTGTAYRYARLLKTGKADKGQPDWDLSSIVSPFGALLFALDLDYRPAPAEKVLQFGNPRPAVFPFALPAYLRDMGVKDVFRVDADGAYSVEWKKTKNGVEIKDTQSRVAVYVAALSPDQRAELIARRRALIAAEDSLGFDPIKNDADFAALKALIP
jgi:hypothetical protein